MTHLRLIFIALFILSLAPERSLAGQVQEILECLEESLTVDHDFSAKMVMVEEKAGQGKKKHELVYYRRDSDDSFLLVATYPSTKKGNGYLRVGDNFWVYRRNTRSFQHVNRDESVSGTNMKLETFEKKKLTELYRSDKTKNGRDLIYKDRLGDIPVYKFILYAKVKDVAYPKQIMWVRRDNFLPLKIEYFSVSGTHMLTSLYLKYTKIKGRYFWIKLLNIDEFEKGNKTVADISGISLAPLDDVIFTKPYLENLSN
ncbi:outer membrane lipoprotein-sorting protein [Desulfoluna sp.]|uniref:outer membrane lipoprotein-sorting protein n=1 Tax=Desulfoluna sp. TaxID=2045199 RepID=UPI00262FA818|nr:outer membrane lipoprotein-sorting protein [Desulfoluna sp.]